MITKPLLAGTVKQDQFKLLEYPLIVSPKLDGIRCLKINDNVVSRQFKPIPNRFIRSILEEVLPNNIDGEIMLSNKNASFQEITSSVMKFEGQPDFVFSPFDYVKNSLNDPYVSRLEDLKNWYDTLGYNSRFVRMIESVIVYNETQLYEKEHEYLTLGYEGLMLRDSNGIYKCGRSSIKEKILLKIKRFEQSEAKIIDVIEKKTNENELEKDEFGYAKRSSAKSGIVNANTFGSFIVKDIVTGHEFKVGSGFDDEMRNTIWNNKNDYIGKIITYTYQKVGVLLAPRFPVFKGFRDEIDL